MRRDTVRGAAYGTSTNDNPRMQKATTHTIVALQALPQNAVPRLQLTTRNDVGQGIDKLPNQCVEPSSLAN